MSFIIGSKNKQTGYMSISSNPQIHESQVLAEKEARRLASKYTDKKFVTLRIGAAFQSVDVEQTSL